MVRFNVNYHNFYSCIYRQLCDSGIKLFESCVAAGHNRSVQHTIIISFTRLGLVGPKKLCWQAAGRLPDSVDCHFSPSTGHQKIFLVLLNIFRLLLAVLAAVLFITVGR